MRPLTQGGERVNRLLRCVAVALLLWPPVGLTQSVGPEGELVYHARARDTLIGLGRRLLIDPRRWPEVQSRNSIADPRHIPLGNPIRIPYSWLRLDDDTATVIAVSGDARAAGQPVSVDQTLPPGSRLQTGSDGSLTLHLADSSVLTLNKLSTLVLEEMRHVVGVEGAHTTRFKLETGRLQTQVKHQADVGRFEIRTPVAVSAVRGTEFRDGFDSESGGATTETLDGVVEVAGSGASVSVPSDFGTRVEKGAPPRPPIRLLPAPDLQSVAGNNNSTRLHLTWPAVPDAARYRFQLSAAPEFQAMLADVEVNEPQVDLPAPTDGNYWLRVRAIDGIGLEGHDAVRELAQHQVLAPVSPTLRRPEVTRKEIKLGWDAQEAVHYRVQVARDPQFDPPLVDQITDSPILTTQRFPPGIYYARVQTITQDGTEAPFGPSVKFRIALPRWLLLIPLLAVIPFV
jgi:hypothetical protein